MEQEQQREHDIPQYSFRGGVVEICQDLCQQWVEMRKANPAYWLAFCHFLAEVYQSIIVAGEPLKSLSNLLFAMLHNLLQPPCVLNFDEVDFGFPIESFRYTALQSPLSVADLCCCSLAGDVSRSSKLPDSV